MWWISLESLEASLDAQILDQIAWKLKGALTKDVGTHSWIFTVTIGNIIQISSSQIQKWPTIPPIQLLKQDFSN